jgi:hypothetical protein
MPNAMEVRPERWSEIWVLFDNDQYSVISGVYDGGRRVLGERWNGESDSPLGFPNVSGHSVWHVVPRFLEIPVLHGLLDEVAKNPGEQAGNNPPERILQELRNRYADRARAAR